MVIILRLFCAVFLVGSLSIGADSVFAQDGGGTHTVKAGESLSSIAAAYNVSISALIRANGISNPNVLAVGKVLVIPAAASSTSPSLPTPLPQSDPVRPANETIAPTPSPQYMPQIQVAVSATDTIYTVRPGESLSAIARRYGTSVGAIVARNNLPSSVIYGGQRLIIPAGTPPVNPYVTPTTNTTKPAQSAPSSAGSVPTPTSVQETPGLFLLPTAVATPTPSRR